MALKDLIRTTASVAQSPAPAIELNDRSIDGNRPVTELRSLKRDLFGDPNPSVAEQPRANPSADVSALASAALRRPALASVSELEATNDAERPQAWSREDIESFNALGAELRLESNDYGEVWLVPNYTSRDRREITLEHLRVLASVMAILPGSRITAFNHPKQEAKP